MMNIRNLQHATAAARRRGLLAVLERSALGFAPCDGADVQAD
jgi:hypothetical protein